MIGLIRDRCSTVETRCRASCSTASPRLVQAEALDELLRELGRSIDICLRAFTCRPAALLDRLLKRADGGAPLRTTRPRRSDKRLAIYDEETAPLGEYYRSTRGNVVGIHADRTIEDVFHEIQQALRPPRRGA